MEPKAQEGKRSSLWELALESAAERTAGIPRGRLRFETALDLLKGGACESALDRLGEFSEQEKAALRGNPSSGLAIAAAAATAPVWALEALLSAGWIEAGKESAMGLGECLAKHRRAEALEWLIGEKAVEPSELAERLLRDGGIGEGLEGIRIIREMGRRGEEPSDEALKELLSRGLGIQGAARGAGRETRQEHPMEDLLETHAERIRGFQKELCACWARAMKDQDLRMCAALMRMGLAPEGLAAPKDFEARGLLGNPVKAPTLVEMALVLCKDPENRASVDRFNPVLSAMLSCEETAKIKREARAAALSALRPAQMKSAAKLGLNPLGRDEDGTTVAAHWAKASRRGGAWGIDEGDLAMSARIWPEMWLLPNSAGACGLDFLVESDRREIERAIAQSEGKALKSSIAGTKAPKRAKARGM